MSDQVGNPEDRFSHNEAHIIAPKDRFSDEDAHTFIDTNKSIDQAALMHSYSAPLVSVYSTEQIISFVI